MRMAMLYDPGQHTLTLACVVRIWRRVCCVKSIECAGWLAGWRTLDLCYNDANRCDSLAEEGWLGGKLGEV